MDAIHEHDVDAAGLRLHYREAGPTDGKPVLLLHGWPTSSYLWRAVMGPIAARGRRVLALDLPGFGASDKPLDVRYDFPLYERALDGFLDAVGVRGALGLTVHDLGGPVGLHWASRNPDRLERLALLNTIVYLTPPSLAVLAFVEACRVPGLRWLLTSDFGLRTAMAIGVRDPARRSDEMLRAVAAPFATAAARRALWKAGCELAPRGLFEVARWLPSVRVPVRAIYGAEDRILPATPRTMERVARELPQAEVTALPGCGHFLQEDRPDEVARLLADFFA